MSRPGEQALSAIEPEDIAEELETRHRDVMLDLILAWGKLDGALGMMLARVLGIHMVEGAELVERMSSTARLAEMRRAMQQSGNDGAIEAARMLKKHKKDYEKLAPIRNLIAHSNCAGYWMKHPDYIVFLTYKKVSPDELAIDAVHIQGMRHATVWAVAMTKVALEVHNIPYGDPA